MDLGTEINVKGQFFRENLEFSVKRDKLDIGLFKKAAT